MRRFRLPRFEALLGRWLRPTLIPSIVAMVVIVAAGVFADHQNTLLAQERLRAQVTDRLSVVRAKLEGNINGSIALVRGLVGTIATEPEMTQQRFAALAYNLFREQSQLRSVAAAPDMVVTMTYPLAGNERAIGLNYLTNPAQRDAAVRVRDTGQLILAGPVDLVQGGRGFVARLPVYNRTNGYDRFWGLVSAVVDVDRLYADSGLLDPALPIDIAIVGNDGLGAEGRLFFGDAGILDTEPVMAAITLPSGSWQISAIPRGGWSVMPDNAWLLRGVILAAGLIILVPIAIAGKLAEERKANIAVLRQRERELDKLSARLGLALDISKVGVWEYDVGSGALLWDDRMNELYGFPADDGPRHYTNWEDRIYPEDRSRALADFKIGLESGNYTSEFRVGLPSGEVRSVRTMGAIFGDPAAGLRLIGVNWDVTEDVARNDDLRRAKRLTEARNRQLETAKARIEFNSLHDSLTGLPNRRYLDQILSERAAARPTEDGVSLLHIDLDRFKQINDTLGHAAGDAVLVHVAKVLREGANADDFVARIGGDEFVIVCSASSGIAGLAAFADRIIIEMRRPVIFDGHECRCGVSIGIAIEAGIGMDARRLLVNADIALYRAKDKGRNRHEFFSDALQAEVIHAKRIADDILGGLERNEFIAHYQPQFDAKTHDIIGVEALARWQHPTRGLMAPAGFLSIAEDLNVVSSIDRIVLEQALADLGTWRAAGLVMPRISVNVSLRRLHDEDLIKGLRQLEIEPGTVSFELVESIYLDESDEIVAWNIDQLKELGIDIEIDDFGTGYASIVSLQKLRPKRLKIDRQLVDPIVTDPAQRRLLASIVDIGKSLGIEVLAEGVETMDHARLLAELGCDSLQGYAFARPMSAEGLKDFMVRKAWRKAS